MDSIEFIESGKSVSLKISVTCVSLDNDITFLSLTQKTVGLNTIFYKNIFYKFSIQNLIGKKLDCNEDSTSGAHELAQISPNQASPAS